MTPLPALLRITVTDDQGVLLDTVTLTRDEFRAAPRDPAEDNYIWRETCDRHDTFIADHEPTH